MQTVKQNTAAPTRKVSYAGIGAVAGTLIAAGMHASNVAYLKAFIGYPGVEAAIGGGLAFVFAYIVKERLQ